MATGKHIQGLRVVLLLIGAALVVYGAVMLMFFGNLLYDVLNAPDQVSLVDYILRNIKVAGPAMVMRTPEGQVMYVEISESVKAFAFTFMGIAGLGVVAGVVRMMIWGGVEIIKVTLSPWSPRKKQAGGEQGKG